ncbi:MAG: hypothetical protein AVDCRST_MAG11-1473 [uncultured Gemmatimonadaceae bacterium]|uniref:Uncharacterized protein n=1 Tax=uncultured Gemmatimonadaceae bacterium TaxID=246130 RepID=A0A6J4KT28_9BACT|nr:MAG: hypothetical protein AVDCRST_MAG11-1473 [uncultured Gemmatimonadaceae bacterium]
MRPAAELGRSATHLSDCADRAVGAWSRCSLRTGTSLELFPR